MDRRMKRKLTVWAIVAVLATGAAGCAGARALLGNVLHLNHQNDFAEQQVRLDKQATTYGKEQDRIIQLVPVTTTAPDGTVTTVMNPDGTPAMKWQRRPGVMTDLQYSEFHSFEQNVAIAEQPIKRDFEEWKNTGTKPVAFDGHAKTLLEWQQKLINLVRMVRP